MNYVLPAFTLWNRTTVQLALIRLLVFVLVAGMLLLLSPPNIANAQQGPKKINTVLLLEGMAIAFSLFARQNPDGWAVWLALTSPFAAAQAPDIPVAIAVLAVFLSISYYHINAEQEIEDAQTEEEVDKIEDRIFRNNLIAWNAFIIPLAIFAEFETPIAPIVIFDRERFAVAVSYRF